MGDLADYLGQPHAVRPYMGGDNGEKKNTHVRLVGLGWGEEERLIDHLVLGRLFNGSVHIMGPRGPITLLVRDRVERASHDNPELAWKEVTPGSERL